MDRGALGAATHLARLVPQHKMRAMVYTSARATAAELHQFGSVLRVVGRSDLVASAREVAREIAAKSPTVIRAAKQSLNGIDPIDVKRSYRYEQGFTFEPQPARRRRRRKPATHSSPDRAASFHEIGTK